MRPFKKYSQSLKLKVVEEVLQGHLSKADIRRKYDINASTSIILKWMRNLGVSELRTVPTYLEDMKAEDSTDNEALKKRIRDLERALDDAELKAEGYSRMIDIAEKELKVSIRKKPSAKQSKK